MDKVTPKPVFTIGDMITIRPYEWLKQRASSVGPLGQLYFSRHSFIVNEKMKEMCGKSYRVVAAATQYDFTSHRREVLYWLQDDLDQWSWLEEWLLTPEEATNNYCITQCPCGKAKVAELLKECDSVWDVVDEMKCYTKRCSKTPACELTPHEDQPQLN